MSELVMPMSSKTNLPAEAPKWGPKMRALSSDLQRNFVECLFDPLAPKNGLFVWAARAAGFKGNPNSLRVTACRLKANPKIKEAIREMFEAGFVECAPGTLREMRHRLHDRTKPTDQIRAIRLIADRVLPVEKKHHVVVEDVRPSPAAQAAVLRRIDEICARLGLAPVTPPKVIDAVANVEDNS